VIDRCLITNIKVKLGLKYSFDFNCECVSDTALSPWYMVSADRGDLDNTYNLKKQTIYYVFRIGEFCAQVACLRARSYCGVNFESFCRWMLLFEAVLGLYLAIPSFLFNFFEHAFMVCSYCV